MSSSKRRTVTGSAGCVTLPPDDFEKFMDQMRDDPDGKVPVTVVTL